MLWRPRKAGQETLQCCGTLVACLTRCIYACALRRREEAQSCGNQAGLGVLLGDMALRCRLIIGTRYFTRHLDAVVLLCFTPCPTETDCSKHYFNKEFAAGRVVCTACLMCIICKHHTTRRPISPKHDHAAEQRTTNRTHGQGYAHLHETGTWPCSRVATSRGARGWPLEISVAQPAHGVPWGGLLNAALRPVC